MYGISNAFDSFVSGVIYWYIIKKVKSVNKIISCDVVWENSSDFGLY